MSKHSPGDDDDIIAAAREGFLEEAQDNLRQFEQGLLAMEQDPGDAEAVNSAFRAAHTIKGGAGLFGFQAVVGFTLSRSRGADELALADQRILPRTLTDAGHHFRHRTLRAAFEHELGAEEVPTAL